MKLHPSKRGQTSPPTSNINNKNDDSDAEQLNDDFASQPFVLDSTEDSPSISSDPTAKAATSTQLAVREQSKWLNCSKLLFFVVILVAAGTSAFAVWRVSASEEERAFGRAFADIANAVLAVANLNAEAVERTYEAVGLQITAESVGETTEWPFVRIRGFEARAEQIINFTETALVGLTPLVREEEKNAYQQYVGLNSPEWIQESLDYVDSNETIGAPPILFDVIDGQIAPAQPSEDGLYAPIMYVAPILTIGGAINYNLFTADIIGDLFRKIIKLKTTVLSNIQPLGNDTDGTLRSPSSYLGSPVYKTLTRDPAKREVVAIMTGQLQWIGYFKNLLPMGTDPIYLVLKSTCDEEYTFLVDGPDATFMGVGNLAEPLDTQSWSKQKLEVSEDFEVYATLAGCGFSLHLFPTQEFHDTIITKQPLINAITIVATFLITAIVFLLYDTLMERRQKEVVKTANRSNAIITSLFPANVHDRLMNDGEEAGRRNADDVASGMIHGANSARPTSANPEGADKSRPIADLFLSTTIMFADLVGFTAWSSMREPSQVFQLLEGLFCDTFDRIARKLGVFKVETIGDCYLAAAGLPEPNPDHAAVMVRFSKHCMAQMKHVLRKLAVTLGPDTETLSMRIGLHSGAVTAGVLRGEKSRFQLFGDTVNTAARLETTSAPNRIQVSQETADELIVAGHQSWLKRRENVVHAKGKGELQTYWIVFEGASIDASSAHKQTSDDTKKTQAMDGSFHHMTQKTSDRLDEIDEEKTVNLRDPSKDIQKRPSNQLEIQWNVDVLKTILQKVLAMRKTPHDGAATANLSIQRMPDQTVLDEVQEVIALPQTASQYAQDPSTIELDPRVVAQMEDFVKTIASMYRKNSFHNFAHASHVVQSTAKLMSRIVQVDAIDYEAMVYKKHTTAARHKVTYGITSDPITHFSCIMAALFHDVDHQGIPNAQLVKEGSDLAKLYRNQSVAEQNSLDLGWDLLMEPRYNEFRACIYSTQEELERFRHLLVNAVMATDIMDKELGELRKKRWEKAFEVHKQDNDSSMSASGASNGAIMMANDEDANRMATIVIEHLIQASDVAHTMQHWHVYVKWNERLFDEMYAAYQSGRAQMDPSKGWYQGELWFFDNYIIPLAKKLKECGVFGVSSDEYLNYAQANRKEWESRGVEVVEGYMAKFCGN